MTRTWGALLLMMLCAVPAAAQDPNDPDEEGCKDSTLLTRMPGCQLYECSAKDFDEIEIAVGVSEQRATAVVDWLTKTGVDAARLVAKGYGDTVRGAENTSEEGRAKNRGVELKKLNDE